MSLDVLIVDDSPVMRKMISRALGMSGLALGSVHQAGDGAAALAVLCTQPVKLVFADINMPVMDGYELIASMRSSAMLRAVPVVVISTERSEASLEKLERMGVQGYLPKPFTPEALRDVAMLALGGVS